MELQTKVEPDKPSFRIGYESRLMMLGSCFVENMGKKLEYFKFKADVNPCGIVYNPLSVANTLDLLLGNKRLTEGDLLQNNGKWVSLSHHGSFSASDAASCLQNINDRLERSAGRLQETDVVAVTWGTSWVYRFRANGQVVSNCHKFPASAFERFRLEVGEIVGEYTVLINRLRKMKPGIRVLFTVSPIRHWKDGAHGNQLSKAVLLLAIDELLRIFDNVSYFPSYEIVMDELRDYRFYGEDMLHISPQAVDYIWERFRDQYVSDEAMALMKRIDLVNRTLSHRPSDPDSEVSRELHARMMKEAEVIGQELGINYF